MDYLTENDISYTYQSGFRKKHSADTSLLYRTIETLTGFDSGLFTEMVLIDLQKVFDTINHELLLRKMASLGFSNQYWSSYYQY